MSRSFNAFRRIFAYAHPGAGLGNITRFTEEDRERKRSYCEKLGFEFAYYADKSENESAEYYAWHGSFESKAHYIAAALKNENVTLINALGGNGCDDVIRHLEVMIDEGELSPRSYEELPTLFGFSDSELLLNFLGKQGFVHPVLSSTQPTAETIAQLTAAEPKDYETQIKTKAFNERAKSETKIEGAMAMHNNHANLTKYRSTGDKFGNILLMETGKVGQFSNEGLDQEIEYLRKMEVLPNIKAILISHTDPIDIAKVSQAEEDDCPPIFYGGPFGHGGPSYGTSIPLPLHTKTVITAPLDSDGEFTLKTTTKRTAEEIAEQRLLYQEVGAFPRGAKAMPQNCMVLLHREICGNSLSLAPGFIDGDFTGKDLVVVLRNHPKYREDQEVDRDMSTFDPTRYALNDLRNLGILTQAQSITFTTSGDFSPRLANFINDYCRQFGIKTDHLAIMDGKSEEEAFHRKCGYQGSKKEEPIPAREVEPEELKIILARKVSLQDALVPDPSVVPVESEKSQGGAKSPEL